MFSEADYINGWLAYGVGAIVGLWCWWYLLSKLPIRPLRPFLVGAMAGFLCMPWYSAENYHFLAPAWVVAASEGLFDGPEYFWRAGTPLIIAIVVMAVLGVVLQILFRWFITSRKKPEEDSHSATDAGHDDVTEYRVGSRQRAMPSESS